MPSPAGTHAVWTALLSLFHRAKYLLALMAFIGIFFRVWGMLDPPEPLRISPETTVLTEPIAEDGLPDYYAALVARMKPAGVTPSNNGAVLFWQAVGPGIIDEEGHRQLLFAELGCSIPSENGVFQDLYSDESRREVGEWIVQSNVLSLEEQDAIEKVTDAYLSQFLCRHWDNRQSLVVSDWLSKNTEQIDRLGEAIRRPHFYNPSPSFLERPALSFVEMLLYATQESRKVIRAFAVRSMHLEARGERRLALKDLDALLRYAEWNCQEGCLVQQLVGFAGRAFLCKAAVAMVSSSRDAAEAEELLAWLERIEEPSSLGESTELYERLVVVDSLMRTILPQRLGAHLDYGDKLGNVQSNEALSVCVEWMNRCMSIAKMKDRIERQRRYIEFEKELVRLGDECGSGAARFRAFFFRRYRSELVGKIHISLLTPAISKAFEAEDRSCAQQRLTLLAAALKLHQLRHGEYPDSLDVLAPEPLAEIPLDPFTDKPFVYERRDEGFAIWSLGRNGVDDGGSDQSGEFVNGEYAPIDWTGERPKPDGPDDVVVRLPVPAFELPGVLE